MKRSLLLTLPLLCAQIAFGQSAVPGAISYQGRVADASGVLIGDTAPVNRKVTLRLYDSAAATTSLYTEEQTVTINKGVFSVLLGQGLQVGSEPRPAISSVFNGSERFLGVTVDDGGPAADPEITPRQQIVSTAYAFTARNAEVAGSVQQASGTSNMNGLTVNNFTVNGLSKITESNVLEFGVGKTKADAAGQIGYQSMTSGLDIVGAGETAAERKITMHAQGGTDFIGPVNVTTGALNVGGSGVNVTAGGLRVNSGSLDVSGGLRIIGSGDNDNSVLEFGAGVAKGAHNGKIGYKRFSNGLDLVGAGDAGNGSDRRIYFHAQGGSTFLGPIYGNLVGNVAGTLDRGSNHGIFAQSWGEGHTFGSQDYTTYSRTAGGGSGNFAWYMGGQHSNVNSDSGNGDTLSHWNNDRMQFYRRVAVNGNLNVNNEIIINGGAGDLRFPHTWAIHTHGGGLEFWYQNDMKSYVDGAGNYVKDSDRNLKRDIKPMADVLEKVLKLKPATYHYKEEPKDMQTSYGFIAQDVQILFPDLVTKHDKGTLGLNYDGFVPLAIAAIQEQQKLIEEKEAEIAELKKELAAARETNTRQDTRLAAIEKALEIKTAAVAPPAPAKKETKVASRR